MTIEVLTKFDPLAMVEPKIRGDVDALLNEALYELENINMLLDQALPDQGFKND